MLYFADRLQHNKNTRKWSHLLVVWQCNSEACSIPSIVWRLIKPKVWWWSRKACCTYRTGNIEITLMFQSYSLLFDKSLSFAGHKDAPFPQQMKNEDQAAWKRPHLCRQTCSGILCRKRKIWYSCKCDPCTSFCFKNIRNIFMEIKPFIILAMQSKKKKNI